MLNDQREPDVGSEPMRGEKSTDDLAALVAKDSNVI